MDFIYIGWVCVSEGERETLGRWSASISKYEYIRLWQNG